MYLFSKAVELLLSQIGDKRKIMHTAFILNPVVQRTQSHLCGSYSPYCDGSPKKQLQGELNYFGSQLKRAQSTRARGGGKQDLWCSFVHLLGAGSRQNAGAEKLPKFCLLFNPVLQSMASAHSRWGSPTFRGFSVGVPSQRCLSRNSLPDIPGRISLIPQVFLIPNNLEIRISHCTNKLRSLRKIPWLSIPSHALRS